MSPRLPVQVETCAESTTTGSCLVNGSGASRIFQILYRNEEIALKDVIMFRAHLLGEYEVYLNINIYVMIIFI